MDCSKGLVQVTDERTTLNDLQLIYRTRNCITSRSFLQCRHIELSWQYITNTPEPQLLRHTLKMTELSPWPKALAGHTSDGGDDGKRSRRLGFASDKWQPCPREARVNDAVWDVPDNFVA